MYHHLHFLLFLVMLCYHHYYVNKPKSTYCDTAAVTVGSGPTTRQVSEPVLDHASPAKPQLTTQIRRAWMGTGQLMHKITRNNSGLSVTVSGVTSYIKNTFTHSGAKKDGYGMDDIRGLSNMVCVPWVALYTTLGVDSLLMPPMSSNQIT